jgi:hypothetical protein
MPQASRLIAFVGSACLCAASVASSFEVTSATAAVGTDGCSDACDALLVPACSLLCELQTRNMIEFATSNVVVTPISITASATADAFTMAGGVPAQASSSFEVLFTLTEPTFVYVEWNIFFPVAENNFLVPPLPADGIWLGQLQPGDYFISASHLVSGEGSLASGAFVQIVPDPTADCDNDGVFDYLEIVNGTQQDANFDGVPDDCVVAGDLDGDGSVGASDLAILLGAWGGPGDADLDGDGVVGASDLAVLLGLWG